MVVTSSPSTETARVRQLLMRRPLTKTVQAPHWPWSQPFLVPVSFRSSRRRSRSEVRESTLSCFSSPLTVTETGITLACDSTGWSERRGEAHNPPPMALAPTATTPAPTTKSRRETGHSHGAPPGHCLGLCDVAGGGGGVGVCGFLGALS